MQSRRGTMRRYRIGTTYAAPPPAPCGDGARTPFCTTRRRRPARPACEPRAPGNLTRARPAGIDTVAEAPRRRRLQSRRCPEAGTPCGAEYEVAESPVRVPPTQKRGSTRTVDPKRGACADATTSSPITSYAGRGRASGRLRRPMPARHPEPPRPASAHRQEPRRGSRGAARGGLHDVALTGGVRYLPAAGSEPLPAARAAHQRDEYPATPAQTSSAPAHWYLGFVAVEEPRAARAAHRSCLTRDPSTWRQSPPGSAPLPYYPMRRSIPTVNVAVAMTAPTIPAHAPGFKRSQSRVRTPALSIESCRVGPPYLGSHLGKARLELVGGDVIALLGQYGADRSGVTVTPASPRAASGRRRARHPNTRGTGR